MKVVVQKSRKSFVSVDGKIVNKIERGLTLLVGVHVEDTLDDVEYIANKILHLRIFEDEANVMNKSILDVGGEILSISQFTLYAITKKGNRPSYIQAMKGEMANKIYEALNNKLNAYVPTYPGVFGADMLVSIENDGPTTIIIDSKDK